MSDSNFAPSTRLAQPQQEQKQARDVEHSWTHGATNAASAVVGTAGNILGGAVNLTGQAIGNVGRGLGKTLSDAGDSIEGTIGNTARGTEGSFGQSERSEREGLDGGLKQGRAGEAK
ncbi:hypothetical protein LTR09_000241 [Extremus antarcticus]|uniref:CsbD-like domain-containing protein n=1 Tax=Extremus antarcticus TaxID=702011 RepID=A0AAJ0GJE4_9PEZI|nr:hypothetical protein LTR09_000241 [Extremus antarcticus]